MSSIIFQGVAYMNVNEMIKDVYFAIYSKLGKSITFESLLDIYKKNEYRYRGEDFIYEEDIEDEKKWQKDSAEVIQLAKDAVAYIFNFPEYTVAIDIKFGNDDYQYDGDFLQKIKVILSTNTIKMLLQLVDFVYYYNVDTDITE